jgi:hypothetical protein
MEQVVHDSTGSPRFPMLRLTVFSALALVLAAVGIVGVVGHAVTQRTREIGLRMALGARTGDALRLVISGNTHWVLAGLAVGAAGSAGLTLLSELLFGVRPLDPVVLGLRPAEVCKRINGVMCSNVASGKFITMFYCVLDAAKRKLTYSNAGHNPPVLLRGDATLRLEEGGALLGVFRDWKYEQCSVTLEAGDRLPLFTDGLSEAENLSRQELEKAV